MLAIRMVLAILVCVVAGDSSGLAQTQQPKWKVFVWVAADDYVTPLVAYAVKEELRRSQRYESTPSDKDALVTVALNGQDPNAAIGELKGLQSAIAVGLTIRNLLPRQPNNPQTFYPIYLGSKLQIVGRDQADNAAKSIVAYLDAKVDAYAAFLPTKK